MQLLSLKGEYMVSLKGPHGTFNNVIFKPSLVTIDLVRKAAVDEEAVHCIEINDAAGCHVMNRTVYISDVRYQYNTLLFVTNG